VIFCLFWPKFGCHSPLDPCNQKCLFWIGRPGKPSAISNRILVISRRHAFICIYSNFSPKIGCDGNAPLSLVYGSVTDEFPHSTNPISKPNSAWMLHTTEVMAIFVTFLTKIYLPWQRPLDICNQKYLLWTGWPRKPPVISNRILVISRKNAFIAILVSKLVAMVTPLCPLCMAVSQMNSPIAQTLSQNQSVHGYVAYNWRYGHFCDILAYFGQNLVAMATPLAIRNVFFGLVDHIRVITFSLSLAEIHLCAFIAILDPKLVVMVTPLCPLCTGVLQMNSPIAHTLS